MNTLVHTIRPARRPQMRGGFTIIETLVAVTVLMIAVAGPLSIASKGLTAALYARDQMIATGLAQEGLEIVKNMRSNNIALPTYSSSDWLTNSNNFSGCSVGAPCDLNSSNGVVKTTGCLGGCRVYLDPDKGYTTAYSTSQPTQFKRYFYIERPPGYPDTERRAHVVVTWDEGTVSNAVELTAQLTAALP